MASAKAKTKTVSILGTDYTIIEDNSIIDNDFDGLCDVYSKIIRVRPTERLLGKDDSPESKVTVKQEIIRHEIIHAFFGESGMTDWQSNETLVQWIAIMFPKIARAIVELEGLI